MKNLIVTGVILSFASCSVVKRDHEPVFVSRPMKIENCAERFARLDFSSEAIMKICREAHSRSQ